MSTHADADHYCVATSSSSSAATEELEDIRPGGTVTESAEDRRGHAGSSATGVVAAAGYPETAGGDGLADEAYPSVAAAIARFRVRRPRKNPHPTHIPPGSRTERGQHTTTGARALPRGSVASEAPLGGPASSGSSSSPSGAPVHAVPQAMADDTTTGTDASGMRGSDSSSGVEPAAPTGNAEAVLAALPVTLDAMSAAASGAAKPEPAWPPTSTDDEHAVPAGAAEAENACPPTLFNDEQAFPAHAAKAEPVCPRVPVEAGWPPVPVKTERTVPPGTVQAAPAVSTRAVKAASAVPTDSVAEKVTTPFFDVNAGLAVAPVPVVAGLSAPESAIKSFGVSDEHVSEATKAGGAGSVTPAGPAARAPVSAKRGFMPVPTKGGRPVPAAQDATGAVAAKALPVERAMVYISGCALPPAWTTAGGISSPTPATERARRPTTGSKRPFLADDLPAVTCNLARAVDKTLVQPSKTVAVAQPTALVAAAYPADSVRLTDEAHPRRETVFDRLFGDMIDTSKAAGDGDAAECADVSAPLCMVESVYGASEKLWPGAVLVRIPRMEEACRQAGVDGVARAQPDVDGVPAGRQPSDTLAQQDVQVALSDDIQPVPCGRGPRMSGGTSSG